MADPLAVLLRFTLYGVLGLLFGLLAFRHYAPSGHAGAGSVRLPAALAAFGALLSGFGLADLAARMHGLGLADIGAAEAAMILSLPGLGSAFIARIAALLVAMALLLGCPGRGWLATACAGAALVSLAWQGHAGASEGRAGLVHLLATALHLLAAGIWLGALVAFVRMAKLAARSEAKRSLFAAALARFHGVGALVVATLVLTGSAAFLVIAGWPLPASAFQSTWLWLLAAKLLAFLAMLGLAAANRFRLAPDLDAGHQRAVERISNSIAFELALALLILALVAWLGLLAPDPG